MDGHVQKLVEQTTFEALAKAEADFVRADAAREFWRERVRALGLGGLLYPDRQPRPGYRFAADGQGGFREEPDTITFQPLGGGPVREPKLRTPPQDGGQALEP